jgi:hypothetical protein
MAAKITRPPALLQGSFPKNDKIHPLVPYSPTYHAGQQFATAFELNTDTQYKKIC